MRTSYLLLLIVTSLLVCVAPALAVTLTGNAVTDFGPAGGMLQGCWEFSDTLGDLQGPAGGCADEPLGNGSFLPGFAPPIIPASGFNIGRVVTNYDCATDTLYIGMDVCDPKIAWDDDGDGSLTVASLPFLWLPTANPPGTFSDTDPENYTFEFDVTGYGLAQDLKVTVQSISGTGTDITTTVTVNSAPGTITVDPAVTGPDVEITVHGIRAAYPLATSMGLVTKSGSTGDLAGEDQTSSLMEIVCPQLTITKEVACSPNGTFGHSVSVLRGAPVYYKVVVTNTGTEQLDNVVVSDVQTGISCLGIDWTPLPAGVTQPSPGTFNIAVLGIGEANAKTLIGKASTDPLFAIIGVDPDCTNTAEVTSATGHVSGTTADLPTPVSATVNVLVPGISCTKLVGLSETGPFVPVLDLSNNGDNKVETVWFKIGVTNTGEVPINFTANAGNSACPDNFVDSKLEIGGTPGVSGPPFDIDSMLRAKLDAGNILPVPVNGVGGTAEVVVGPVSLDETVLCPDGKLFTNTFTACGVTATPPGVCAPETGQETVSTTGCQADVKLCTPPVPCVSIDKTVACSSTGTFEPSVSVLRGAPVYYKVVVTNCGNEQLDNVVFTDVQTGISCVGIDWTPLPAGVTQPSPGTFNIATLDVSTSVTLIGKAYTDPAFATIGNDPDCTNTAEVTNATGHVSGTTANLPTPVSATVNVLVPGISCTKLVGLSETGPFVSVLDLNNNGDNTTETVYFQIGVTNTGEVPIDFTANLACADNFVDDVLEIASVIPGVSGPPFDIDSMLRAKLDAGNILPKDGGTAIIVVGPVLLDETVLCPAGNVLFINRFSACGVTAAATVPGVCLPDTGEEAVSTTGCQADVKLCTPTGATRTPGYWMTHAIALQFAINAMYDATGGVGYKFANLYKTSTWPETCAVIGDQLISNINVASCEGKLAWELLKATPGKQPDKGLHIAAILEFQLIAAIANEMTLKAGGVVVDGTTLSDLNDQALLLLADCVISPDEYDLAMELAGKLGAANEDAVAHSNPLPDGFPTGPAKPKFFGNKNCP